MNVLMEVVMDMVQRPPVVRLYQGEVCADFFAGGGGTSTGIEMAIGRSPDVAINHDKQGGIDRRQSARRT